MGKAYSTNGEKRNAKCIDGKLEGKRSLGRPTRGREENIKMNLDEIEWIGIYLIDLAE
jgi:hypothetical protein